MENNLLKEKIKKIIEIKYRNRCYEKDDIKKIVTDIIKK